MLISALRVDSYFCDLAALQVRIAPKGKWDVAAGAGPPSKTLAFSKCTARLLAQSADQASDPELAAAFGRLAKTAAARVPSPGPHPKPHKSGDKY